MASTQPMARVPFAPLDNPRLQHLASAKNRQNGVLAPKSGIFGGKQTVAAPLKSVFVPSTIKRPLEPTSVFEEYDSENIDPSVHDSPTKKTKGSTFNFSLTSGKYMPPPPFTPIKANISTPRTPLTAPAGRSPTKRRQAASGISKTRRISAPFSRIDPPFASRGASTLPFSLDAALSGTFSTPFKHTQPSAGATIQESVPKSWYFDIYEDTPEEEAANLMEHSTLTLDLSSDDESIKKDVDEKGKENIAPAGYAAPSRATGIVNAATPVAVQVVRKKIVGDEMDDGLRSPLSDLETEYFIPEGLDKENCVVLIPEHDGLVVKEEKQEVAAPPQEEVVVNTNTTTTTTTKPEDKVEPLESTVQEDIVVFEDKPELLVAV